jgi:hypothetical protein
LSTAVRLLGRIVVIFFAFLIASLAAGTVLTLGILAPDLSDLFDQGTANTGLTVLIGFTAFFISGAAFLPMLLIVLMAESFGWRSVLFYAAAGLALALFFRSLLAVQGQHFFGRELEIMAAAGIAAGLIYWAVAGRNAGKWRKPAVQAR